MQDFSGVSFEVILSKVNVLDDISRKAKVVCCQTT